MNLSTKFREIKQGEFEKSAEFMEKPLIRFHPDGSGLKKAQKQSIDLRVNPGDVLNEETFKYPYTVFETGTVEDLLLWGRQLTDVIEKKPLELAPARFGMVRVMLDGEARDKWDAIVEKTTMRGRKDVEGVKSSAPGKTLDTFDECIHKFKRLWFYPTHRSLTVQRDYPQHNIRFPTGKGLPLGEFVNRIISINSKLREFPSPLGYSGNKFFFR